jgi:Uma2 family endonuclease
MATVAIKPMTADEFFDFVHRPENRDRFFELERGEIVEMPPPKKYHGFVCCNAGMILWAFAARRKKGYPVTNDSGIIVETAPDTVRGPDVSFYEDDQNADTMDRKYSAQPPKLVVDVLSPDDSPNKIAKRVGQFLAMGVGLVWIIDPELRTIAVYQAGKPPKVLGETEELTGEDVLPDFRCRVAEFFALPGQ